LLSNMKSTFKIFGTIALAAVGASMANAYAQGVGSGYSSATYYQSQAGLYFTAASGQYYGYAASFVGSNWAGADYYGGAVPDSQYSTVYGYSQAGPQVGGAGFYGSLATENFVTLTNLSSHYDTLYIYAQTQGYGSGYSSNWNEYGAGVGAGEFFDSYGLIFQESVGEGFTGGRYGGASAFAFNYDIYNGSSYASYYGGNSYAQSAAGSASDFQLYILSFAPGASDSFYTYGSEAHVAYSTTPGPAAVAPFALGLIGALRRRKKA